jgi:hypothetical protein
MKTVIYEVANILASISVVGAIFVACMMMGV